MHTLSILSASHRTGSWTNYCDLFVDLAISYFLQACANFIINEEDKLGLGSKRCGRTRREPIVCHVQDSVLGHF
uniref:Uncharacterized protein n=1 Tax=Oryza meridionalis TaxID=40149 RepID=A0A0E0DC02_9ORYZ